MTKFLIRPMFVLTLVALLLTTLSTVIGQGIDTPVAVALVVEKRTRGNGHPTGDVALFDLQRFLRADRPLPLANVRDISFNYPQWNEVLFTTYYGSSKEKIYQAGFYRFNFINNELMSIASADSSRPMNPTSGLYYNFSVPRSSDGRQLVYIDPLDDKPYLMDMTTGESTVLMDEPYTFASVPNAIVWSPDSTKIAIKKRSTLYIYDADGHQQLIYPVDTKNYYPSWVNSEYLSIERFGMPNENLPIEVVNTTDGSLYPLTQGLQGRLMAWPNCDGEWLTYTQSVEGIQEGYLLNMRSGESIRVNDDPLLADQSIGSMIPSVDCSRFAILIQQSGPILSSIDARKQPIYRYDIASQSAEYLTDIASLIDLTDDTLVYQRQIPETNKWQVVQMSLNPIGESVVIHEYSPVRAPWLNWSPDRTFATYVTGNNNSPLEGSLHFLDVETDQTRTLTGDDEQVQNHALFNWSELQQGETVP